MPGSGSSATRGSASKYIAFYADKEIKPAVARILHHRDNVEWSSAEATRLSGLTGDSHRNDRKIGAAINASLASPTWSDGRYQVFILSSTGHPGHIELKAAIPHLPCGRGRAFVQRHRYVSHHALQSAKDTSSLR
ncbi:hypothetical protein [Nocardia colli]|uniref:hypothetical protein n=1 Tax=Nocardia colli TaxID=2545717 RepID=UPI001CC450A7|nr:hypothetical protein [Nocardia colli]